MIKFKDRQRIIQESVPGKQVTIAHVIARPKAELYNKLDLPAKREAIGLLILTPSMTSIIAADTAAKAASVSVEVMDRFSGAVIVTGDVADVETALKRVTEVLGAMGFTPGKLTKT